MRTKEVAVLYAALAVAGCSTYQVTPTTNSTPGTRSGQVDVLYSPPQRPYTSVGIVSAKRYKPGWTDPTASDAVPQLREAGAQVGADAVIVRSTRALNDRHVVVEGEAIRYTDVASNGGQGTVQTAAAAQGFSSGRGCGVPTLLSESNGVTLFQAKCPAGATLIVECRDLQCNARN
jgi:hypothetical protein